jgi:hypothetical protein
VQPWVVDVPAPIDAARCGVYRTDLHLAEGDLSPQRPADTPGHEVVGGNTRENPPRPGARWPPVGEPLVLCLPDGRELVVAVEDVPAWLAETEQQPEKRRGGQVASSGRGAGTSSGNVGPERPL